MKPFSFYLKAEHHAEESDAGKKDTRRTCGVEIETSEFDIKKIERESIFPVGLRQIIQPEELQIGLELWSRKH